MNQKQAQRLQIIATAANDAGIQAIGTLTLALIVSNKASPLAYIRPPEKALLLIIGIKSIFFYCFFAATLFNNFYLVPSFLFWAAHALDSNSLLLHLN